MIHIHKMSEHFPILHSMMYSTSILRHIEVNIAPPRSISLHSLSTSIINCMVLHCQHGANVSAIGMDAEQPIHWAAGVGHAVGLLRVFQCLELTLSH